MKIIEYGHHDIASSEQEIKNNIAQIIECGPDTISVLPSHTKLFKSLIPENIKLSTVIDYPLGIMDSKTRLISVENAIKSGTQIVEILCPSYFLCNRKYDKFREDITNIRDLCSAFNVETRYILEYRIFTLDLLYKISQILIGYEIKTIYPSSGYLLDDISDNILACGLISKKVDKIKLIANGNVWTDSHIDLINKTSSIIGIKCHNIFSLKKACELRKLSGQN